MEYVHDLLRKERQSAEAELASIDDRRRQLRARIREIDDALATLGCDASVSEDGSKPARRRRTGTLQDRIVEILAGCPDGMAAQDVAHTLTETGRETSSATVSSILSRLRKDNRVIKDHGRWFAADVPTKPQNEEDPADAGTVSGVASSEEDNLLRHPAGEP